MVVSDGVPIVAVVVVVSRWAWTGPLRTLKTFLDRSEVEGQTLELEGAEIICHIIMIYDMIATSRVCVLYILKFWVLFCFAKG